jgi:hypothetical protein
VAAVPAAFFERAGVAKAEDLAAVRREIEAVRRELREATELKVRPLAHR